MKCLRILRGLRGLQLFVTPISTLLIWNLSFFLQHPGTPFTSAMACGWIQMSACCTSVWLLIGVWISRFKDIMARDRHVRIMDIKAMETVVSSKWKIHLKEHVVVHANVILFKFLSYTKKHVGSNPIFYTNWFQNTWTLGRFKPTSWWEAVGVSRWTKWLFRCVSNAPGEDEGLIWAFQTDTRQVSGCHQNQNHEVPKKEKQTSFHQE